MSTVIAGALFANVGVSAADPQVFVFQNRFDGLCMSNPDGGSLRPVVMTSCDLSDSKQQWYWDEYGLHTKSSDLCAAPTGGTLPQMRMWPCDSNSELYAYRADGTLLDEGVNAKGLCVELNSIDVQPVVEATCVAGSTRQQWSTMAVVR
ncbi:MAG: ricin-type beta-trefoil lectin domain protein [Kutzneria sp.]|nr:ricin-type beta-trefoil lectin domain protein [Kutzneria sp.]MBV9847803.1 ricin-type beta-trefoil lectin domain protein [Kutzneria sp.]